MRLPIRPPLPSTPFRETHNNHSNLCWRGDYVEFQFIDTSWEPEMLSRLIANLDAIHKTAIELTGFDFSGPHSHRVIIREAPGMPSNVFSAVPEAGVLQLSSQMSKTRIGSFGHEGETPSWLIDRSFERLIQHLHPLIGFQSATKKNQQRNEIRAFLEP